MESKFINIVTAGVHTIIQNARKYASLYHHTVVGLHHYLLAAVERNSGIVEKFTNPNDLRKEVRSQLMEGNIGKVIELSNLIEVAQQCANQKRSERIHEIHFIEALLKFYPSSPFASTSTQANIQDMKKLKTEFYKEDFFPKKEFFLHFHSPSYATIPQNSTLLRYGINLTEQAIQGKFRGFIGREREIKRLIRILLHQRKRNPLIVGPAGVGKTELVRGLACYLISKNAPKALRNYQIYQIYASSILSNASLAGEVEGRIESILREAKKSNIILFFDELHMLIGAGANRNLDISNILKPALAGNEILVIGATTDDEYSRYIESDKAFSRRFHLLRLQAMDKPTTLQVMKRFYEHYQATNDLPPLVLQDDIYEKLYDYADIYLQERHFPDKALDLLEETISYALSENQYTITQDLAAHAVKEFIGMPINMVKQVQLLQKRLEDYKLLETDDIKVIIDRLSITVERFDLQPHEPNLTVVFYGEASYVADVFCEMVAETLFEDKKRVISIDLSQMTEPFSIVQLIGATYGYVGYGESVPLDQVRQSPWCVIKFSDLDHAHPKVVHFIADALEDGYFTLANNRKISISEAVIVFTMSYLEVMPIKQYGFKSSKDTFKQNFYIIQPNLQEFIEIVTDHCVSKVPKEWSSIEWIKTRFIDRINAKMAARNIFLDWDEAVIKWILDLDKSPSKWEDIYNQDILPKILNVRNANPTLIKHYIRIELDQQQPIAKPFTPPAPSTS